MKIEILTKNEGFFTLYEKAICVVKEDSVVIFANYGNEVPRLVKEVYDLEDVLIIKEDGETIFFRMECVFPAEEKEIDAAYYKAAEFDGLCEEREFGRCNCRTGPCRVPADRVWETYVDVQFMMDIIYLNPDL